MLQVSTASLISLVIIMLICFVLPLALFYPLYRYADCRAKTLGIGAAAYIACAVVIDTVAAMALNMIADLNTNAAMYLFYAAVVSPVIFIAFNYFVIKRFGSDNINNTGDTMMYSLGYSSVYNIFSTGIIAVMYFMTLLNVKNRTIPFDIVSDADYVSMSDTVSASNLINQSAFDDLKKLCAEPVSYYMTFCLNCLWVLAAYAAVFIVIWLAVKKTNKPVILAFAFMIRLFITLPDVIDRFGLIGSGVVSAIVSLIVLVIVWAASLFCRKTFIDSEDAPVQEKK